MLKIDIQDELSRREGAKYILSTRHGRGDDKYYSDWKTRVTDNDMMYAGDWETQWPDGVSEAVKPIIVNLHQTGLDDLGRLVVEVEPQIRVNPAGQKEEQVDRAYKVESILRTWDIENDVEELNHEHALNLGQTGLAFEAISVDRETGLPFYTKLDPRGCYPRFHNGRLIDLIVVSRVDRDMVAPAFDINLESYFDTTTLNGMAEVEVIDYYDTEKVVRVVAGYAASNSGKATGQALGSDVVNVWRHELSSIPVAWGRLKTGDGAFRGIFDQVKGIALTQNRVVNLETSYAEQLVYSPFFAIDVDNDTEPPGPRTIYRGRSPESRMQRVAPAGANPQLFGLMEILERYSRSAASMPASRAGEVQQSIASASFVNSTMGILTTMVKSVQKEVARLWRRRNALALECFEKYGGIDESGDTQSYPLEVISGQFSDYTKADIQGRYQNTVRYGAGAGLDALNKKQAVAQDVALGFTSKETAMEQTDYLLDISGEKRKIAGETVEDALTQRMLTDPNIGVDLLMRMALLLRTGMTFLEAAAELAADEEKERAERMAAEQAAAAGPAAPGVAAELPPGVQNPEAPVAPPEGGGGPGLAAPEAVAGPAPPLTQVLVRQPGA